MPDHQLLITGIVAIVALTAIAVLGLGATRWFSAPGETVAGQALVGSGGLSCLCSGGSLTCTSKGKVVLQKSCDTGCNAAGNGCALCSEGWQSRCKDGKHEVSHIDKNCLESEKSATPCEKGKTCYAGKADCEPCKPNPADTCSGQSILKAVTDTADCQVHWHVNATCVNGEICSEGACQACRKHERCGFNVLGQSVVENASFKPGTCEADIWQTEEVCMDACADAACICTPLERQCSYNDDIDDYAVQTAEKDSKTCAILAWNVIEVCKHGCTDSNECAPDPLLS